MRTVKIPNCEYSLFENIRDIYLEHMPWAILKETYSKTLKVAVFTFHDSRYVAIWLKDFILEPPAYMDDVEIALNNTCSADLEKILADIKKSA